MDPATRARTLERLLAERPRFHDGDADWSIGEEVLRWFVARVEPGAVTLETGCGYSSVVLASLAAEHVVVSPSPAEHDAIRRWCDTHDVSLAGVRFLAGCSQRVLPGLAGGALDLVLIDGEHAFPAPFIDWYYTAERVRPGGFACVDDTQLLTGRILRDFLAKEAGRWALEAELGKTAIFRRVTSAAVADGIGWGEQPFCRLADPPRRTIPQRAALRLARAMLDPADPALRPY